METRLNPPIQLPGTGELWAGVGRTALAAAAQAGEMLQKSPLNPAVKEQMNYAINNFKLGEQHNDWVRSQGPAGQMITGTTPEGASTLPGGTTSIDSMIKMALLGQRDGGGGGGGGGKGHDVDESEKSDSEKSPTASTSRTDVQTDAEGVQWFYNPATSNWERVQTSPAAKTGAPATKPALRPKDRPKDASDLLTLNTQVPSQGGSTAALTAGTGGVLNTGQPQSPDIEAVPAAQYRAQQQGGSIWSPQRPAPLAPPAPDGSQPAQPVAQTPAAATQADQAAMQKWQEQNAHPVLSSQDALKWMKNQTTLAQDATYLPMGGPGGSPAYAFHIKGGGVNTVPISQMVQKGAGALVAAQNTSAVLSATDQAQQGGQVPELQAPAAPTAPQIAQGPPPAPGAYSPAAYQMPQGPTITQAGAVNPALMAGGTNEQAAAAAQQSPPVPNVGQEQPLTHLTGRSMEELSKMDGDPDAGSFAGFNWHQDRHDGRFYTTMKSPSSTLNEQRNYWGGPGWQDMPMEESGLRQALRDAVKTTRGITFSDAETRDMPVGDVKFWLEEAKYLDKTGGDPSGTTALHIKGTTQQAQSITRIIDALEAAKKAGVDPKEYSQLRVDQSKAAADRDAIMPDDIRNPSDVLRGVQARLHDWNADSGPVRPLADELAREAQYFGTQMGQTPGITYTAEGKPENRGTEFSIAGVPIHLPGGTDTSPLQQVSRIFQNQPADDVIKGLKEVRQKLYDDIDSSTDLATRLNFRTPPSFKAVQAAVHNGQDIPDKTNKFKAGLPSDEMLHGKPIPPPPSNFYQERLQPLLDKWFGQQGVQNVEKTFKENTVFGGPQQPAPAQQPTPAGTPHVEGGDLTTFIKNHDNGTPYTAIGADGKKHTYQVTK